MEKMTIELTVSDMAAVNEGLMFVPYGRAAPVINSINSQIQTALDRQKDKDSPSRAPLEIVAPAPAKAVELIGGDPYPEIRLA